MSTTRDVAPPRSSRRSSALTACALLGLVVGAGLFAWGVAWTLPIVVVSLVVAAFGVRLSWATALAGGTIVPLVALAGAMALFPSIGMPLMPGVTGVLITLGLGAIAYVWSAGGWRVPDRPARLLACASLVVPGVVGALALVGRIADAGVSWAMWNDAVIHLGTTHVMIRDGGLDLGSGNRDPLANELLAVFTVPGRGRVDPQNLLHVDADRQALVMLLLLVWMSVLISVLVARAVPVGHPGVRSAVAVLTGLLPWTWYISGFAIPYGFINALVATVVLIAAWLLWIEARRVPTLISAILMLASVASLAAWAILAVVPIALGAWTILRYRRTHVALRGRAAAAWIGCLLFSGAYALTVTLHDVRPHGDVGLSGEGAFFTFDPIRPALIFLALAVVSVLTTRSTGERWERLGIMIFLAASGSGLLLLLAQRRGPGMVLWGYYPQKYVWVLSLLAIVMAARVVAQGVSFDLRRRRDRIIAPAVVVAAALALMAAAPPNASPLVARGWWGIKSLVPVASIVDGHTGTTSNDMSAFADAAPTLFATARPNGRVLLVRYLPDPVEERWVNDWLVEQAAFRGESIPRRMAVESELTRTEDLCAALRSWGAGVTVMTRDPGLGAGLSHACADAGAIVDLSDPA